MLVDVDHTMEAMTEETFGPTLPIMKVRDAEEALRLANDSPYGLAGSVWTKDIARGEGSPGAVEAGAVCVNDAQLNYVALELPMGGWKVSGMGSRHGAGGIRKYTRQQTMLVTRLAPKKDMHMFPYKARTTKLLGGRSSSCTGAASATDAGGRALAARRYALGLELVPPVGDEPTSAAGSRPAARRARRPGDLPGPSGWPASP